MINAKDRDRRITKKQFPESMQIVDKCKKRVLVMVYPTLNISVVDKLAGKYKNRVKKTPTDMKTIKEDLSIRCCVPKVSLRGLVD